LNNSNLFISRNQAKRNRGNKANKDKQVNLNIDKDLLKSSKA